MSSIDLFMQDLVRDMRRRLALLGDCGDRRAIEDGIALLTDCRDRDIDEARFETLLVTLRSGRAPAGLSLLKPQAFAQELDARWRAYRTEAIAAAGN